MNRRTYLTAVSTAGVTVTAGCRTPAGQQTLSEPTVSTDSPGRKTLTFLANEEEVGHVGVDGSVDADHIRLSTEIWRDLLHDLKAVASGHRMTTVLDYGIPVPTRTQREPAAYRRNSRFLPRYRAVARSRRPHRIDVIAV
ncbi:hypothetical protein ACFR9U_15755 [Halorientalis brevis]|uniref:DUF8121 domain-containing protein n=1 Tax=Halorientalis brevis TaxID=1126241 RepID=A0ABD6CF65_9EURY|nr:hypothetical protein [Halorientalis brevis]